MVDVNSTAFWTVYCHIDSRPDTNAGPTAPYTAPELNKKIPVGHLQNRGSESGSDVIWHLALS